jgi:hypothetical protein
MRSSQHSQPPSASPASCPTASRSIATSMTTTSILVFETVLALIEVSALALLALEFRSQSLDRRSSAAA